MTNELTLENIRSGAFPSDAHAVGFLLGEIERLQTLLIRVLEDGEPSQDLLQEIDEAVTESAHEPIPCARCAAVDARTQAIEQLPRAERRLPNDDVHTQLHKCEHCGATTSIDCVSDFQLIQYICGMCGKETRAHELRASPANLVGALQDVVHTDPGPVRAGRAAREWHFDRYRSGKLMAQGVKVHAVNYAEAYERAIKLLFIEGNKPTDELRLSERT
jgi:hypothetical protein